MSTIYRISDDPDGNDSLLKPMGEPLDPWWPEHGFESWGQVWMAMNGQPLRDRWKPIPVEHCAASVRRNRGKPVDFPSVFALEYGISQRALDLIAPLVGDRVEFLPLQCIDQPDRRYYVINIIDHVDCIDLERSELYWDETHDGRKFIRWVYRYVFKPGSTDGHHLFRPRERPTGDVLVSEEFKRIVEENNLVGLDFYPATEYLPDNATPTGMRERREREQKQRRKRPSQ